MQNLQKTLIQILREDSTYFSEEKLLKNKLTEDALKLEPKLIKYVLSDNRLKKHFFLDIDSVLVFDKDKFIQFVNDKQFLPDSYTSFKNTIGLVDENGDYFREKKDVVLAWPYKDCVLEGGQDSEDQKRDEIFHNEILAPDEIDRLFDPKVLTNFKRYDKGGENPNPEISRDDNLIIKGNNLLVLHSLKKLYQGKVKLIYIDPPFNTGDDDFRYNDKFSNSTWLTFMKNRLSVAKEYLTNDSMIFIHIDDQEIAHLKVLIDEIFGRDNFLSLISYQRSGTAGLGQGGAFIINTTEYIFAYAKNKHLLKSYEVRDSYLLDIETMKRYHFILKEEGEKELVSESLSASNNKPVKIYKHSGYELDSISLASFSERENEIRQQYVKHFEKIYRTTNPQEENRFQNELISKMDTGLYSVEYVPSRGKDKDKLVTRFYNNGEIFAWLKDSAELIDNQVYKKEKISDFWTHGDIPKADLANEGGVKLKRGKKPENLLKRIIELATEENDLVMDFFLGGGTTTAVAHKMGRRYIGIEQLDYGENDSVVRLNNVINGDQTGISKSVGWEGGGSFVYAELKKWNQNYIDEIEAAQTTKDLLAIYEKMKAEAFFRYEVDLSKFGEQEFAKLELGQQKDVLIECLDKNHLYVNLSEMDDATFEISDEDKEMNRKFYGL